MFAAVAALWNPALPDAKGYFPPPSPNRTVRRRPLFILPSGQGRRGLDATRLTGQAFHRARYALTTDAIQRVQASHGRHAQRSHYQPTSNFNVIIHRNVRAGAFQEAYEQRDRRGNSPLGFGESA